MSKTSLKYRKPPSTRWVTSLIALTTRLSEGLFEGMFPAVCPSKAASDALLGSKLVRTGTVSTWLVSIVFAETNIVPGTCMRRSLYLLNVEWILLYRSLLFAFNLIYILICQNHIVKFKSLSLFSVLFFSHSVSTKMWLHITRATNEVWLCMCAYVCVQILWPIQMFPQLHVYKLYMHILYR